MLRLRRGHDLHFAQDFDGVPALYISTTHSHSKRRACVSLKRDAKSWQSNTFGATTKLSM